MVRNHQSVDWYQYFKSIRTECPWSYSAYIHNKIEICEYQGVVKPLGDLEARIYIVNAPTATVESLAAGLDYENRQDEWLFSYPGYGPYATPVPVLIQQNRSKLNELRSKLIENSQR